MAEIQFPYKDYRLKVMERFISELAQLYQDVEYLYAVINNNEITLKELEQWSIDINEALRKLEKIIRALP